MYNYLILDAVFIVLALVISFYTLPNHYPKRWVVMFLVMIMMTVVFDSLIIGLGIVKYYPEHMLGITIGKAPLEDFGYTVGCDCITKHLVIFTEEICFKRYVTSQ
jgi:lycopene cyclase domain-containing protein